METQPEASAGAAQADRQQPMPPSPGATAFKRGRPVNLLHQTGQGKTQLHDTCRRRDGDRDAGDGAQLGVSLAHARALVAPPSLCIFHTAFIRRRMVLALVQDWASSAAVPLMGGPRVGATSNPRPGIRAEGAPDSSIRWAPAPILELITLRSNRRPPLFSWTAVRGLSFATCSTSSNNVRPWHCSQRARTAVLRVQLRWTFVKHACGKLWTLVSTSETQTRINN